MTAGCSSLHRFRGTGPLRKCTCSHFLLFVWGGLTLAETGASIGTGDDEIQPKELQTSGAATPSSCPSLRPDRHVISQVCAGGGGGWSRRRRMDGADDERWVSDGGWRGCFLTPPPSPAQSVAFDGLGCFCTMLVGDAWVAPDIYSFVFIYLFIVSLQRSFWHMNGIPVSFHRHRSPHRWVGWSDGVRVAVHTLMGSRKRFFFFKQKKRSVSLNRGHAAALRGGEVRRV